MTTPRLIYKIVDATTWNDAADPWSGSADDHRDGFIHFSTKDQVEGTLKRHFRGIHNLLLLAVDTELLPAELLRYESSRGGAMFPHLYGDLPHAAVVQKTDIPPQAP